MLFPEVLLTVLGLESIGGWTTQVVEADKTGVVTWKMALDSFVSVSETFRQGSAKFLENEALVSQRDMKWWDLSSSKWGIGLARKKSREMSLPDTVHPAMVDVKE